MPTQNRGVGEKWRLGRAGFVSPALGVINGRRQTPLAALVACSLVCAAFVVANLWFDQVIGAAVLVAGAAALVLYLLSMWALFRLRCRERELLRGYRAPLGWWLPVSVVVLSGIGLAVYPRIDETGVVVPVALSAYALGIAYFALRSRICITEPTMETGPPISLAMPARARWLHWGAVTALVVAVGAIGAVAVASFGGPDLFGSPGDEVAIVVLGVIGAAIVAVAAVELWQTRRGGSDDGN